MFYNGQPEHSPQQDTIDEVRRKGTQIFISGALLVGGWADGIHIQYSSCFLLMHFRDIEDLDVLANRLDVIITQLGDFMEYFQHVGFPNN